MDLDGCSCLLAWQNKRIATYASRYTGRTAKLERLATLQGDGPHNRPSPDHSILCSAGIVHVLLAFAKRELIATAEVQHVTDIEIGETVVCVDSDSGHVGCAITSA